MSSLVILSKHLSTKRKTRLTEPEGQHLWRLSTALSPIYGESLHGISSALYKASINCCKNHLERSIDPNILTISTQ
ncbi:hypothetical protein CBP31_12805 [Oceanisphaera profunda]|uniref:Uncharacterized protein n=1 Tax=Oceanisphaera profunda TaxID=1416627 RepID=A0A1Y0DA71_9GAMM|nr:hypothetical protein CBP31_12805 [Oceanisphaera profunda]